MRALEPRGTPLAGFLREHPAIAAIGPAVFFFLIGIGALYHHGRNEVDPSALAWVLLGLATLPLAARHRAPMAVLVAVTAALIWMEVANFGNAGWGPVLISAFTLTSRRERALRREGVVFWVGVVVVVGIGTILGDAPVPALVSGAVLIALALAVGDNTRRRRTRAAEIAEREVHERRERELLAEQHVREERTRIARELHDVVAHSVSVMVIQAAAARRRMATDPQQAAEAMIAIEDTGRSAMAEMRRLLGVLRDDAPPSEVRAPQPSLAMFDELIGSAGDLPIVVHTGSDLGDLPPAVELSAYRIVQEALTNVRRHAGPVRRVDVNVRRAGEALEVEVVDDGRGAASAPAVQPGYGLLGMRERVSMFGGVLRAGPRPGGGWHVAATIPIGAS